MNHTFWLGFISAFGLLILLLVIILIIAILYSFFDEFLEDLVKAKYEKKLKEQESIIDYLSRQSKYSTQYYSETVVALKKESKMYQDMYNEECRRNLK